MASQDPSLRGAPDSDTPPPVQKAAARLGGESRTAGVLMQLEREARRANGLKALQYLMVNQTRRLIAYRQAVLLRQTGPHGFRVEAVSNVAALDRNAPYVAWLRRLCTLLSKRGMLTEAGPLSLPDDCPEPIRADWHEWFPREVFWQPLDRPDGRRIGGLILTRDAPTWSKAEPLLMDQLADCYAHAWAALGRAAAPGRRRTWLRRAILAGLLLATVGCLAIPVRQSVVAPARVAAERPLSIAAPIDGVIAEILVRPNQSVFAGDPLFHFESAELEANLEAAERGLAIAEADLIRARQQAFGDRESKAEIALKEAEAALKQTEVDYGRYLLDRVIVTAPADGIAIFSDPNAWRGRPVRIGESVMQIADPGNVRLAVDIPVADAIVLEPGAEVRMFLDVDPLNPLPARLERSAFEAEETAEGVLSYATSATFEESIEAPPRIGLRGTAKVYGEEVPLALYLFRRPVAAFRQLVGF